MPKAVLDVGSSKVSVLACRAGGGVLGFDSTPCAGAADGGVTDIEAVARAIRLVVQRTERRARVRIDEVCASIAQPRAGLGVDARRAAEREALLLAIELAGLRVADVVPSSIASAAATLGAQERTAGIALADVGAGVTDVVVFRAGEIAATHVLPFGSAELTAQIAACFRMSTAEAEFLKRNVGCAAPELLASDGIVAVPSCANGAGTFVRRSEIARVIAARLARLWSALQSVAGDVPLAITGGGSLLDGLPEVAAHALARPVRRASPFGLIDTPGELQSPAYATIAGLAQLAGSQIGQLATGSVTWGRRRLVSSC